MNNSMESLGNTRSFKPLEKLNRDMIDMIMVKQREMKIYHAIRSTCPDINANTRAFPRRGEEFLNKL